ncbi:hypothetical protein ON010_g12301 [Phytophthora cinnamomi]|nr:hypothetical protein ON010_g12301 [Phytophthora cinnamomi]
MKLVTIIFFVEIFNALYSSSVLQGTSTWYAITLIMGTDILQFGLAMFDTTKLLNEVRALMEKIPRGHPVAQENFVQIAERLMNVESQVKPQPKARTRARSVALGQDRILSWMKSSNVLSSPSRVATLRYSSGLTGRDKYILFRQARVFPISPPQRNDGEKRNFQTNRATDVAAREAIADKTPALGIEAIFSQAERRRFIKKTSQVLFVTEFVMLVEYIEVAMPTILVLYEVLQRDGICIAGAVVTHVGDGGAESNRCAHSDEVDGSFHLRYASELKARRYVGLEAL